MISIGIISVLVIIGLFIGYALKLHWHSSQSILRELARLPIPAWWEHNGKIKWANWAFSELQQYQQTDILSGHETLKGGRLKAELISPNSGEGPKPVSGYALSKGALYFLHQSRERDHEAYQRVLSGMSDTFSSIQIGIAVFDKVDNLVSFNPALIEMLDILPSWLSKKPSLRDFLDRLRNEGKLPEPRDFTSWRDTITALITAARTKTYVEDWHLPNGDVIRVNAKPSARGTVTFTFENITRRIIIEREYRSEIERLVTILEQLDSAIATFDSGGNLTFANQEFDQLWGEAFSKRAGPLAISDMIELMHNKCQPNPNLAEIREYIMSNQQRGHWKSEVTLKNGQTRFFRVAPLLGGYTLFELSDLPLRDPAMTS